ncbi:MAG: polyprenyl synthetase family protein [Clostridia bacterium]|nr:polyprenyl synthetase family protein [Clostridia bacterium]
MNEILRKSMSEAASAVEKELEKYYSVYRDTDTELVRKAEIYSLTAGGKRIRPYLVLEFCRAFGGNEKSALPFAAAVEMMHTFSLIHDDLPCMDDDDLRRGRPTSHKKFGEATALLAGDSLALRAVETAMSNPYVSKETALAGGLALARAAGSEGMIGGQIIDMRGETEILDFETLLKLHNKKTGAMIRVSANLGCLAAGLTSNDPEYAAAEEYADGIGLAFQIIDDILDAESDSATLGKSVGSDAENNKTTFLSFMSAEDARAYARKLTEEAADAISPFTGCENLILFADYLIERKN